MGCDGSRIRHRMGIGCRIVLGCLMLLVGVPRTAHTQTALPDTAARPSPLSVGDRLQMGIIDDVALSSEGRFAAYTVRRVVKRTPGEASGDRIRTATERRDLYVASVSGREPPRLLTRGTADAYDPAWHPDSDRLAFVRPVEGTPQIFVLPVGGGAPYQLTDVRHGATAPQWSPTGNQLLFASALPPASLERMEGTFGPTDRPGRTPQDTLVTLPPDTLIVLRDTATLDPVDTLAARPDGRLAPRPDQSPRAQVDTLTTAPADSIAGLLDLLKVRLDTLLQRPAVPTVPDPDGSLLQVRRWLGATQAHGPDVVSHPLPASSIDPTPRYQHYFLVSVPNGIGQRTPPRPTPRRITSGFRTYADAVWLPTGAQIIVSASPPADVPRSRVSERNLYLVSTYGGPMDRLLHIPGMALRQPRITSDGTTVAFLTEALDDPYTPTEIGVFPLDGRTPPTVISGAFDHAIRSIRWSPDGWHLYTTPLADDGIPLVRFTPFAHPDSIPVLPASARLPASRDSFHTTEITAPPVPLERLTDPLRHVSGFDVSDASVVYAARDWNRLPELYANTVSFRRERQLSRLHPDALQQRATRITVDTVNALRTDSVQVRGWLLHSRDTVRTPRPLLVDLSPVPTTLDRWHQRRVWAARGLAVLAVAPPQIRDGAPVPWPTLQTEVEALLRAAVSPTTDGPTGRPIDGSRVGVVGRGSYAPLAAWLTAHTDRFRVAIVDGGLVTPDDNLGVGRDSLRWARHIGGMPWDGPVLPTTRDSAAAALYVQALRPLLASDTTALPPRVLLERRDPLAYAPRMDTPLLLLTTEGTPRATQTERLYRRLTVLRHPVEMARYPSGNALGHRLDRLVRIYEFSHRFLTSRPDASPNLPIR